MCDRVGLRGDGAIAVWVRLKGESAIARQRLRDTFGKLR
jgi:hypothetical protein